MVYQIPAVILAQFTVACAFAVRTMRATFDQIDPRREQVALTLGASRLMAFTLVVLPEAWRGMLTAATLAWARALGEFGPLLIFAGTTRMKTEVLSTSVFLELTIGDLEAAIAVSLIMVVAADDRASNRPSVGNARGAQMRKLSGIELDGVSIRAGAFQIENINLVAPKGGYIALMGKTGSGKTTILEAIVGLRGVTKGSIRVLTPAT